MPNKNLFPTNVYEFLAFAENFIIQCQTGEPAQVIELPELAKDMLIQQTVSLKETQDAINKGEDTPAKYAERDYERKALEDNIRNVIKQFIAGNPNVTPQMLKLLHLNVPDTKRTPINISTEPPCIKSIKNVGNHSHEIIIWGSPEHRAKLFGVQGYEIRSFLGEQVPKGEDFYTEIAKISTSKIIIHYSEKDFGKIVHYIASAYGNKNQHSDWSEVVTRVID